MKVSLPPPLIKWWSAFARVRVSRRRGHISWIMVACACRWPAAKMWRSVWRCALQTLELQNIVRLHVHALIRSSSQQLAVRHLGKFDLEKVPAHLSTGIRGVDCNRGRAKWSGFLYCCLKDKKSTVFAEATKQPFTGFLVNPQWIVNLVQAHKLDVSIAHDFLVKCVNGSKHIKDLQAYDQEMEKIAVKQAVKEAERLLGATLKEQKRYPLVQAFLNQFKKAMHRYRFLVLAGPSRVGKTEFARSLCEPGMETLEVKPPSDPEMTGKDTNHEK